MASNPPGKGLDEPLEPEGFRTWRRMMERNARNKNRYCQLVLDGVKALPKETRDQYRIMAFEKYKCHGNDIKAAHGEILNILNNASRGT